VEVTLCLREMAIPLLNLLGIEWKRRQGRHRECGEDNEKEAQVYNIDNTRFISPGEGDDKAKEAVDALQEDLMSGGRNFKQGSERRTAGSRRQYHPGINSRSSHPAKSRPRRKGRRRNTSHKNT